MACAANMKKFIVAEQVRLARRIACPKTKRAPVASLVRSGRWASDAGGVSGVLMRLIMVAENRKETASATTATGAVSAWTSAPPTAGPITNDIERLVLSLLLAAT